MIEAAAMLLASTAADTGGGGGEDFVPTPIAPYVETQGLHFIASDNIASFGRFYGTTAAPLDNYDVYINGTLTTQKINAVTAAAGDEVLIAYEERVEGFRGFPVWSTSVSQQIVAGMTVPGPWINFIGQWLEPLPVLLRSDATTIALTQKNQMGAVFSSCPCFADASKVPANFFGNLKGFSPSAFPPVFKNCQIAPELGPDFFCGLDGAPLPMFWGYTQATDIPVDIFTELRSSTVARMVFYESAISPVVRITAPNITNVSSFCYNCSSKAVVYVPAGSTTAETFKASSSAGVAELIEE